ncbi:MAG: polysaccharide deacetylase family protein [Oscillospiraceae bacterium]
MKYIKVVVPISLCVGIALLLVCTFLPYGNKEEIDSSLDSSKGEVIASIGEGDGSKAGGATSNSKGGSSKGEIDSHTSIPQQEDGARTEIGKPQSFVLTGLSKKAVSWGPGREVDEENKPTACVSLNEKYSKYGAIFLMNEDKIYLSFDLGYEAGYTDEILDTLKENGVKAMFFLTESYAETQEKLVRRIIDEGHTVGSHSVTHPQYPKPVSSAGKE